MVKTSYLFVALISLAFVVSACGPRDTQPTGAPRNPFIGGSSGVVINFEEDSPPPEVTDQAFPFKAIVRLTNEGEAKVDKSDIIVRLLGFSPKDFNKAAGDLSVADLTINGIDDELRPETRDAEGKIIDGTTTFVEIPKDKMLQSNPVTGNTQFTFRADICYKYQARAQARLCILKDLINIGGDELCDPDKASTVFSSSSPVRVSSFRQSVIGKDKVTFSFDVVHSGNGNIFELENAVSCPRDDLTNRRAKLDKVNIEVDAGAELNDGLNCNLESEAQASTGGARAGKVRLIGGKRTIICTLSMRPLDHDTDFEKIANIKLEFNYDDDKETRVLVKHLPDVG